MKRQKLNELAYSLIGIDGNAFSIIGYVRRCMKQNHHTQEELDAYTQSAKNGDYNNLLATSIDMIEMLNLENGYEDDKQFEKEIDSEFYEFYGSEEFDMDKALNETISETNKQTAEDEIHWAILNAIVHIWQENPEITQDDVKEMLTHVFERIDVSEISIFKNDTVDNVEDTNFNIDDIQLEESKRNLNESKYLDVIDIKTEVQDAMKELYGEFLKPQGDYSDTDLDIALEELEDLENRCADDLIILSIIEECTHASIIKKFYKLEVIEITSDYAAELKDDIQWAQTQEDEFYDRFGNWDPTSDRADNETYRQDFYDEYGDFDD